MSENVLVLNKIDSLPVEEKYKKAMKELFISEIQLGSQEDVKKIKVKRCRDIVTRGQSH